MDHIHLQHTLPQVFAGRDTVISQVWHQDIVFDKGKRYLIEASSGTGKSSLCSYIYGYRRDYQFRRTQHPLILRRRMGRYKETFAQHPFPGTAYLPRADRS